MLHDVTIIYILGYLNNWCAESSCEVIWDTKKKIIQKHKIRNILYLGIIIFSKNYIIHTNIGTIIIILVSNPELP